MGQRCCEFTEHDDGEKDCPPRTPEGRGARAESHGYNVPRPSIVPHTAQGGGGRPSLERELLLLSAGCPEERPRDRPLSLRVNATKRGTGLSAAGTALGRALLGFGPLARGGSPARSGRQSLQEVDSDFHPQWGQSGRSHPVSPGPMSVRCWASRMPTAGQWAAGPGPLPRGPPY